MTSKEGSCRVYEQIAATDLAVEGIRPGGIGLTERALDWCRFSPSSRILDVGCGTGVTLHRLSRVHKMSAIGLDAASVLLSQNRKRNPDFLLVRADAADLPFPDKHADGLLAECSLSVMNKPDIVLDEFRRVLKNGGKLILSDVYATNPDCIDQLAGMPEHCCMRGAVSRKQLMERLTTRSFRVDLWEDHSDRLTEFAVQLVFSYGSMNQFWLRTGSESVDLDTIQRAVSLARPGYYLLIAEKVPGEERPSKDAPL